MPYLLNIFLSVTYGFLLLFGLDASTRSLAPSAAHRRRLRAREERHKHKAKQQHHRHKLAADPASPVVREPDRVPQGTASESSEGSVDGLSAQFDLSAPGHQYESRYHFAMRSVHGWAEAARGLRRAVLENGEQTREELVEFLWAMRGLVAGVIEAGMKLGGIGVAGLNDGLNGAFSEGREIGDRAHAASRTQKLTGPSIIPNTVRYVVEAE